MKTRGTAKQRQTERLEQVSEENGSGRRASTYVTSARAFRSFSFEPDAVKDSASVSSTPSKRHNRERMHRKLQNIVCKLVHVKQIHQCKYWDIINVFFLCVNMCL